MTAPSGNKKGRPKKSDLEAVKTGNRGQVGRPAGDTAIMNEYKARMLASPKSAKVLETILNAALNDEHPHQAAAWKIVADRIVPVSAFDQTKNAGSTPTISINITGLNSPTVETTEQVYDITDVESRDV
jgi:hypothetical protein